MRGHAATLPIAWGKLTGLHQTESPEPQSPLSGVAKYQTTCERRQIASPRGYVRRAIRQRFRASVPGARRAGALSYDRQRRPRLSCRQILPSRPRASTCSVWPFAGSMNRGTAVAATTQSASAIDVQGARSATLVVPAQVTSPVTCAEASTARELGVTPDPSTGARPGAVTVVVSTPVES
jgi:hypothetical protein